MEFKLIAKVYVSVPCSMRTYGGYSNCVTRGQHGWLLGRSGSVVRRMNEVTRITPPCYDEITPVNLLHNEHTCIQTDELDHNSDCVLRNKTII